MNTYKVTGEVNRKGEWRDITKTIKAANEKIAVVKATEWMHIIIKVIRIT